MVGFIKMKSDSTRPQRGRERADSRAVAALRCLLSFFTFPWVWERAGFLSNYPTSFLDFPGLVLVPLPLSNLFPGLFRVCAFLLFNLSPSFSQASALPIYGFHFGFYRTCLRVLLCHLASTKPVLS